MSLLLTKNTGRIKSFCVALLINCLIMLPASPVMAVANNENAADTGVATKSEPVILTDHKKAVVQETGAAEQSAPKASAQNTPAQAGKPTANSAGNVTAQKGKVVGTVDKEDDGLSTLQWVGIGAGVAVVAVGIAALASSSSDSGPKYPSETDIVGAWRGQGTCLVDTRTYDGTYTFYSGGTHIYDIYLSSGEHHTGRGTWSLPADSNSFTVNNDTGSVYKGDFQNEVFTSVTLYTTNGRWKVTLTKK